MSFTRPVWFLFLCFCLLSSAWAQDSKFIEGPGGRIERYMLPNRVTILLQPMADLPTVAVSLAVPVGSALDPAARPGTCRLLAQLLSRSPSAHPQGSLLLDFEEMGARSGYRVLPAWTLFHEVVPRQQLAWLLGVEMERLRPARWSAEEIERQSLILAQDWRSEGASLAGAERRALLSRLQGGQDREPSAISASELQQFALQYWDPPFTSGSEGSIGPVLAIVGGFSSKAVRGQLARLGARPASLPHPSSKAPQPGPSSPPAPGPTQEQAGGRQLHWLYPLPSKPEEMAVLTLLDAALGSAGGLTTSMDYLESIYELRSPASASSAASAEEDLHGRLRRAALALFDPEQLKSAKSIALRRFYRHFEDIEQRAAQLALDQGVSQLERLARYPEMLRQLTPAAIANQAVHLLDDKLAAKIRPAAGSFVPPPSAPRPAQVERARPTPLKVGAAPDFSPKPDPPPPFTRLELDRGITILVQNLPDLPTVTVRGFLAGGASLDSPELAGRSQLLTRALEERVRNHPLGRDSTLELRFSPQAQFVGIDGWAPRDALNDWLTLLAGALSPQPLSESQMQQSRERILSQWHQDLSNAELQAYQQFLSLLFTEEHPMGRSTQTCTNSTRNLTLPQANALLTTLTRPNNLTLAFSGDVTIQEVAQWFTPLLTGLAAAAPSSSNLADAAVAPRRLAEKPPLVRLKGANAQALVLTGTLAPGRKDPDYYAFSLLNQILGGESVTSRLAVRLRARDGLASVVQSRFLVGQGPMPFLISLRVQPDKVEETLNAVQEELERLRSTPVSALELQRAVHSLEGQLQVSQQSSQGRAGLLRTLELFHLSDGYSSAFSSLFRAVTPKDIQEVAKRRLAAGNFCTVVLEP